MPAMSELHRSENNARGSAGEAASDSAAGRLYDDTARMLSQMVDTVKEHPVATISAIALGGAVVATRGRSLLSLGRQSLAASSKDELVSSAALLRVDRPVAQGGVETFGSRFGMFSAPRPHGEHFQIGKLPCDDRNSLLFQETISRRLGLDLQKLDEGKIAVLHPRFRFPEKQLQGKIDSRHDLSLWGDYRQGVGVVEYHDLLNSRSYLSGAQSVVRLALHPDGSASDIAKRVGSGVFVGPADKGLILTNDHVVRGVTELTVNTAYGAKYAAKVIDFNPRLDLAVLKVVDAPIGTAFPAASIGEPVLEPGTKAVAIGHHGALRGLVASPGRYEGSSLGLDAFAIDSSMPGMSGGGIFDRQGKLVAIAARGAHSMVHQDRSFVAAVSGQNVKQYLSEVVGGI
jgi:S1-C subfamily serine protease